MKLITAAADISSDSGVATLSPKRFEPELSRPSSPPRVRLGLQKKTPANKWISLAVILVGPFLGVIDFFIANIGIPSIRTSLGASFSEIELVIAGYGLTYAVCLITGGRLGDILWQKSDVYPWDGRFYRDVGSLRLGTHSGVVNFLEIGPRLHRRGHVSASAFFIQVNFAGPSKRLAFSLYGAMIGFGSIVGQLLGGFLIQANLFHLGWRPIFLINLPIGIITIVSASIVLRNRARKRRRS